MHYKIIDHPVQAEALACFELKVHTVIERYFQGLRERIVALVERDGTLPVVFWMCERDELIHSLSTLYEAGVRLGMELELPPRVSLDSFINLNVKLIETVGQMTSEAAQDITVTAARQVGELMNMGLNPIGLPDRLRAELRMSVLSDSQAEQIACQQASSILAAGRLFSRQAVSSATRVNAPYYYAERVCI